MASKRHVFKKYCLRCEKRYSPTGKSQKLCEKCQLKARELRNKKQRIRNGK